MVDGSEGESNTILSWGDAPVSAGKGCERRGLGDHQHAEWFAKSAPIGLIEKECRWDGSLENPRFSYLTHAFTLFCTFICVWAHAI